MDADLYTAAKTGETSYLDNPHGRQSIPCEFTFQRWNALHVAANFGQLHFAKRLVDMFPLLLTGADSKGNTPLHVASKTGCTEMVEHFLKTGHADEALGMTNESADTALHMAVRNNHLQIVELLVRKDPKLLSSVNNHKESPLYLAVERGSSEIAELFMSDSYHAMCGCEGTKGMTALHAAVIRTHKGPELGKPIPELSVNGLRLRLKAEWFRGTQSNIGQEVPELSLEKLRRVVTKAFFKMRGYFKPKKSSDDIDVMQIILRRKKDLIKIQDEFGWTPLHYAAYLGHQEATEELLHYDKSVAVSLDKEGNCALLIAAKKGHTNVMEEIIKHYPDLYHVIDNEGRTILHIAAQYGNARVVKYILKSKFQSIMNEPTKEGNTPLHLAAIFGHYGIVLTLAAESGVDTKAMNNEFLKAIDIVQSNMDIGEIIKYWIMRKLEHAGGRQSLHGLVVRENESKQNGEGDACQESVSMHSDNNGHQESRNILQKTSSDGICRSASNISNQSSDGISCTPSNTSISRLNRNRQVMKKKEIQCQRLKEMSYTHLLVATLIATVTFAAGFSLPGGYNDEGSNKGKAVFSTNIAFKAFLLSDGIAFYCSTAAVCLHFFASLEQENYHLILRFIKFSAILTYVSILAMVIAFTSGIYLVLPNSSGLSTCAFVLGCLFLSFYVLGVL